VGLKNALPFVGFGFLDNLIMILAVSTYIITLGGAELTIWSSKLIHDVLFRVTILILLLVPH